VNVATVIGGMLVLGAAPFDVPRDSSAVDTWIIGIVIVVGLATLAILKGKRLLGLVGVFIPVFSLVGAVRLASPGSPWARRFYDPDGRKMARSRTRFERIQRRRRRMRDAVAGAPEEPTGAEATVAIQEPPSREVASEQ
jgi:hypothetical protein